MVKPSLGKTCIVPDCLRGYYPGCGVRYYKFPRDVDKRKLWLRKLNLSPKRYHDGATVCYLHFYTSDYVKNRNKLKSTAVPHTLINIGNKHLGNNSEADLINADIEKALEELEVSSLSKNDSDSDNASDYSQSDSIYSDNTSDYKLGISSTDDETEKLTKNKKKKVSHTPQLAEKYDEKIEEVKYDTAIKGDESDETQVVTKVCRICLITDCKMFSMSELNLEQSYLLLTGFAERMFEDTKMPQMLCFECLKGVQNFVELSTKSVTASSILMELIEENKLDMESIKSVDRSGNMLTSKLGVSVFEANSFNVQIDEYEDDTFVNNDDTFVINDECDSKENIDDNLVNKDDPVEIDRDDDFFDSTVDDSSGWFSSTKDNSIHKEEIHENSVKKAEKSCEIEYPSEMGKPSNNGSEDDLDNGEEEECKPRRTMMTEKFTREFNKMFIVRTMTPEEQIADLDRRKNSDMFKNAKFKCNFCYRSFNFESPYQEHMNKHTNECGEFICDLCKTHHRTKTAVRKHIRSRHDQFIQCRLCPFKTTCRRDANVHKKFHEGHRFQCPKCPKSYTKTTTYAHHLARWHPQDAICHLCGDSFVGLRSLQKHVRAAHKGEDFLIKAPSLKSKTVFGKKSIIKKEVPGSRYTVTRFITTLPADSPYCDVCEVRFRDEAALRTHAAVSPIHGNPPKKPPKIQYKPVKKQVKINKTITCEQCGVECANIRAYRSHFADAHAGLTRTQYSSALPTFICEICGRIFQNKTILIDHVGSHSGGRPYSCAECASTFAAKTLLRAHVADAHAGRRACALCGKEFAYAANMRRHMLVHTGKPYSCDSCNKRFSTPSEKRVHILHHHMGVPWPRRRTENDPGFKRRRKPCADNASE